MNQFYSQHSESPEKSVKWRSLNKKVEIYKYFKQIPDLRKKNVRLYFEDKLEKVYQRQKLEKLKRIQVCSLLPYM